jgi:hypothetical protein
MGAFRPLNGRKGASRPTIGREAQKKFPGTSSRIKKLFLFAKRSLKQASRPATGRDAPFLLYFFLDFLFQKLFAIQSFLKYKIYSPNSYEEDLCI